MVTQSVHPDILELPLIGGPTAPNTSPDAGMAESAAGAAQSDLPLNVQQLPPIDGGRQAWLFCLSSFVLETLVWGFGFRQDISLIIQLLTHHALCDSYGIFQGKIVCC